VLEPDVPVPQYNAVPLVTRTCPFEPEDPFAQIEVIAALATMILSIPEVELATSA